jgi:putative chitobiose transport system substrate-binding protein
MKLSLPLAAWLVAAQMASAHAATIEFWTFSMKPRFTPFFEQVARSYEARHPGVTIEWIDFPWDVIQTKLVTRIVAGTPPALVNLNVPWADEYARDQLIMPVDELIAPVRASFIPSTLRDLTFKGHVYGFPMYSNVAVIACNTTLLRRADVARAPRTFDEELAVATQIAARTGVAGIAPALAKIDGLMMQPGLPVLERGRAAFATPRHVAFVAKLAAAYRAGALLKDGLFAEDNFPAVIAAYKGGRLGMLLAPPTAVPRIAADAPEVYAATEVAPAPLGPTGIADGGWLIHFAVPRGVAPGLLPEVGRFARYLTSDANQLAFARAASVYPTSLRAAADPSFSARAGHGDAAAQAVAAGAQSMPHVRTLYVAGVDDYDELRRVLVKAVEAGVTGKQDIAQALAEAAAIWDRKLAP